MKCTLLAKKLLYFLGQRIERGDSLLLGLSGGCDSLALLYLLLECRPILGFELHIAHVDHKWRKESGQEAQMLSELAKKFELPFHLSELKSLPKRDRENEARQKRLAFFKTLFTRYSYRALLLAHHADDQAETVLKRIGEGAGLRGLGGLTCEKKIGNLLIYRPLLKTRKEELRSYLQSRNLTPFWDPSNRDPAYLRARMRETIFPDFERSFGKQVAHHFTSFGELWQEIQSYLDRKSASLKKRLIEGPFGSYVKVEKSDHPLELKWVLLKYANIKEAHLSRSSCDKLIELIKRGVAHAKIQAPPLTFVVNKEHLFIVNTSFPHFLEHREKWSLIPKVGNLNWSDFWHGRIVYPDRYDEIILLNRLPSHLKKRVKERYRRAKVPPFLYDKAPLFVRKGSIISECLTGNPLKTSLKITFTT